MRSIVEIWPGLIILLSVVPVYFLIRRQKGANRRSDEATALMAVLIRVAEDCAKKLEQRQEGANRRSGEATAHGASSVRAWMRLAEQQTKELEKFAGDARSPEGLGVRGYRRRMVPGLYGRRRGAGRSACGLLVAASRLLPASSRERYLEEFRAELHDVAACGAGRWQQVRYAARQFVRAVPVAVAVRVSGRRKAAP